MKLSMSIKPPNHHQRYRTSSRVYLIGCLQGPLKGISECLPFYVISVHTYNQQILPFYSQWLMGRIKKFSRFTPLQVSTTYIKGVILASQSFERFRWTACKWTFLFIERCLSRRGFREGYIQDSSLAFFKIVLYKTCQVLLIQHGNFDMYQLKCVNYIIRLRGPPK